MNFYKMKEDSAYGKAVKKHFRQLKTWDKEIFPWLQEALGENVKRMGITREDLYVDVSELEKEENIKLFKKDGSLKKNTKRGKELKREFEETLEEHGLEDFEELRMLHFVYGAMRRQGETMEMFITSDHVIHYKADFDLIDRTNGAVEEITEVEYQETYLEEIKKRDSK